MMLDDSVKCPVCGCDCVHLQAVQINRGGEVTTVDKDGTRIRAGSVSGRGARVTVTLWCENAHKWNQSFQFHKGSLLVENETLISGCEHCFGSYTSDLWRD